MDPLSVTASIIAVLQLSAKLLEYLNDVKDAPKSRTKCAIEMLNLCSLLYKLRDHVDNGDSTQPWYIAVQDLAVKNGPLDQFKHALETLQTKITDGSRLKKVSQALVWKFEKEEISSILAQIERVKSLVQIALQIDHFKLSQAIKDDTDFVRTHVPGIQSKVDRIQQDQDSARHRLLLEWISSTPDYPAQQSDILKNRQEGTGQWFLDSPEFARWLSEPKETLFCPGIPGAGKTMIAAIAIDHLLKNSSNGVAYLYCSYKAQKEQDASKMLAAILKQLVQGQLSTIEHLERLYQQHAGRGTKPSIDDIHGALKNVLTHYPTVHIVIDALDEWDDDDGSRGQFITKLRDLQAERDIRLVVTSRFIPDIEGEFKKAIKLEVQASKDDVKRFVSGQAYRLPKCVQCDTALKSTVQDKIAEAVDGMFLLARLHIDSLVDKTTATKVKNTLGKLLKSSAALGDAYRDAMERIEGQLSGHKELAKKVISWVVLAKRPLTTAEICCALAVEPEETELDLENIPDVEDIISVCAGLVVVDRKSDIIRLVHYTTQEFFEGIRDSWDPDAQLYIASTCLTYLSFSIFQNGNCSTGEEYNERLRASKFLDYAADHWGEHAEAVEGDVCEQACSFLSQCNSLSAAQALLVPRYGYEVYGQEYPKDSVGLHPAARFGLSLVLQSMLPSNTHERRVALEKKDSSGQTLLYVSAERGCHSAVKLLLENGANVNTQGGLFGNALIAAIGRGHEPVARLLIEKGADINAPQHTYHGNALQVASAGGHEQIVKLLLNKGADINAHSSEYGNALQAASRGGHEQIVKLLLDNGADMNQRSDKYGNALQAALERGHEHVTRLLVDKGADINMWDGWHGNSLQAASAGGHEQIVRQLLDLGADVNKQGGHHHSALYAASAEGHAAVVRLLLDRAADPNLQFWNSGDALYAASKGGYDAVVKLLLDKGADPNFRGSSYPNALFDASSCGYEKVVKLLLIKGADPDAYTSSVHGNALELASWRGTEALVKLLLDNGADPNAQSGGVHGSPLRAASSRRSEAIIKLLIDKGADINAQIPYKGNALEAAASVEGSEAAVKLLLDNGAHVNPSGENRGIALHAASKRGSEAVVKLLLDRGADPNAPNEYKHNTLQAAVERGSEPIVKLLLDKGANPNPALLVAVSRGGSESIVKLLLDKGADVNAEDKNYGSSNVLYEAVESASEAVVKLLLDKGADVNAQGGYYRNSSVLSAAVRRGSEAVVRLLLDRGANPNDLDKSNRRVLYTAISRGSAPIVKLLLEKGADPIHSALPEASSRGYEAVVRLLLNNCTDPDNEYSCNALYEASSAGHEPIVVLLLDKGVDANAQGGEYNKDSALSVASYKGHDKIVRILLDKDANANARGGWYGNALHAASERGHEHIVRMLLDKGADVNAQGGLYGNALHAASERGHEQIVRLLLDNDADVNAQGGVYGRESALSASLSKGHEKIVRLLLDKGATKPNRNDSL